MMDQTDQGLGPLLERIAAALERLVPPPAPALDLGAADAFVFEPPQLLPVPYVATPPLALLKGIDAPRDRLYANSEHFARGLPANNALLWGARGAGKSSLVKAIHHHLNASGLPLKLIEIHREDISGLPLLLRALRGRAERVIVYCDDLSFEREDAAYKSLKAVLEGGLEGRPDNVVFYATSNRRHLMPRDMMENERSTAINPGEAVEEKVSLSDRFGLSLGFHVASQDDYLAMVEGYAGHYRLATDPESLRRRAIAFAAQRGGRSGRIAWQFILDLAGELGVRLG